MFHFSTYRPNSFKHYSITRRFHRIRKSTAAIAASIVETTRQPGSSSSTTLSRPSANFLPQTCIAGLVKYVSPYTGRISDWMAFAVSPFAHSKWITECCSLGNDFNGNVAISNVYIWRQWFHRNETHSTYSGLNPPQKCIFRNFYISKINQMTPFYNLFMERPSYNILHIHMIFLHIHRYTAAFNSCVTLCLS